MEGGAVFEGVVGNRFGIARHRNNVQQGAVGQRPPKRPMTDGCEG